MKSAHFRAMEERRMAHISPDFKTKKAAQRALAEGTPCEAYQPGGIFPLRVMQDDKGRPFVTIEAPAGFHKWYGKAILADGSFRIVSLT